MMDRKAVARVLEQIASFMELKGESTFRVRAYGSAARAIEGLPVEIDTALAEGSLAETKGVGPATLQIVTEVLRTGRSSLLEELREQVPPGLVEMLQISGLGVAKVRQIHEALDIDSLPELEAAARDGRLAKLPRFGTKTAENILKGIAFLRQASAFRLAHHAAEEASRLREALERQPGVLQAITAGDVRRRPPRSSSGWPSFRESTSLPGRTSGALLCASPPGPALRSSLPPRSMRERSWSRPPEARPIWPPWLGTPLPRASR
jgi:DNA polymerase (family 10)